MTAPEVREPARAGSVFGKYRLVASLGQGGMADVYLAVAEGPAGVQKLQVLKRLRGSLADEPEFLSMFLDEARLAARLNHPNVVQTNDVGRVGEAYFIAMEYLDGQPLNRVLQAGRVRPMPPGLAVQVLADALAGLHYAHELADYDGTPLHIVHRDTSPHNIFVTYAGQTKLVDFGIAKAARRNTETNVGVIKGKFAYMSPEQARVADLDRRSDIFVMGMVLWEILAGRRMWKGLDDMEIVRTLLKGDLPALAEFAPDVPPELARICERALANRPEDRYPTAAAMRADLLAYLSSSGGVVPAEVISEYLMETFAERRATMQRVIEQQLNRLSHSPDITAVSGHDAPMSASIPDLAMSAGRTDPGFTPSHPTSKPPERTGAQPLLSMPAPAAPPASNRSALYAAAALLIAAALFVTFGRRAAPAPAPHAEAATAPAAPAAAPAAARVELRIHAEPAVAQMYLDDAALPGNPFTGKFPADGLSHRLRVEAPGYAPRTQIVVFDKDGTVEVALAATASASATPAAPRAPAQPAAPAATPTANAAPAPASDTPPAAAPPGKDRRRLDDPWGGESAKPAAPAARPLDSAEPWK